MRQKISFRDCDGNLLRWFDVHDVQVESMYDYYVRVKYSDDSHGRMYWYGCNIKPKLGVGDVVAAGMYNAPAKIVDTSDSVLEHPEFLLIQTKQPVEHVIWRLPGEAWTMKALDKVLNLLNDIRNFDQEPARCHMRRETLETLEAENRLLGFCDAEQSITKNMTIWGVPIILDASLMPGIIRVCNADGESLGNCRI
jgi:hypothetical protein